MHLNLKQRGGSSRFFDTFLLTHTRCFSSDLLLNIEVKPFFSEVLVAPSVSDDLLLKSFGVRGRAHLMQDKSCFLNLFRRH